MHNEATFQILGRIGKLTRFPKVMKIDIAVNSSRKNEAGDWITETEWPTVSVFGNDIDYVEKNRRAGDLVLIKGRVSATIYRKDGKDVYATDLIAEFFRLVDRPGEKNAKD